MTNWCRNMCTRRSRPVPHSTVRWLRYFSRDKYVQGGLQQQMLTLRARAPHPNVHLAQVKMGKSISKRRANISWATSQIRSGWTDSSLGYLLYMQDLCFWDQLFPEGTATLKRSIRRIKEIYSLERNSLWNHHRSHWFSSSGAQALVASGYLSWMSAQLAPIPISVLRVCWNRAKQTHPTTCRKQVFLTAMPLSEWGSVVYKWLRERCKATSWPSSCL